MACKISIDCFDDEQLATIEKELTLPLKNTGLQQRCVYPFDLVNKMVYLPFSYAITEWSIERPKRDCFDAFSAKFEGTLREEQVVVKKEAIANLNKTGSTLMSMYCGFGKCLGYDTPILCFDGTIKLVQNITTNDQLMGDDGTPRNVLSLARGDEQMYRINMIYGDSFTANKSHILSLFAIHHRKKITYENDPYVHTLYFDINLMEYVWNRFENDTEADCFLNYVDYDPTVNISIENFLELSSFTQNGLMAYRVSVEFFYREVLLDPYFLGLWLGMGNEHTQELRVTDEELVDYVTEILQLKEIELLEITETSTDVKQTRVKLAKNANGLNRGINYYGILNEKRIPSDYLLNIKNIRLLVLAGIIDACGSRNGNTYFITVKSRKLCDDILYLTRSLGFNSMFYDTLNENIVYYVIAVLSVTGPKIPVLLPKNEASCKRFDNELTLMQFSITPITDTDYYGFEIDGNRRFLLGDFTVTHNTITSINLACTIGLKTMIVMNRIVLMNQWEKSIKSVCPNAVVQKIKTKDVKQNADFYIVNAINMPKMGNEWFENIGTAIIDECFTYDTQILTSDGYMKIGDIWSYPPYLYSVLSFNEKLKQFEFKSITNTFRKKLNKKLVTITFYNSIRRIDCTEDHTFLTLFGDYRKAKDLRPFDAIFATYDDAYLSDVLHISTKYASSYHTTITQTNQNFVHGYLQVYNIFDYDGPKQDYVYDIEVANNHNFVVSDAYLHGGVIAHNCHTIVAETLSKSLLRLTPRYLIGLSATPYRPDEMDSLIHLYFGQNKIVRELFRRHTVYMVNTKFTPELKYLNNGKLNWGAVLDSQATNQKRNDLIVHIVTNNKERNFLILTKRVEQARYLIDKLIELKENVTNLVGSKQDYDSSARILVATIQKVSCGFDHAKLDTLLLAADTEEYYTQVLGRIFRTKNTEPLVFDLVDDNPVLKRHFERRREVYRKYGGVVKYIEY